MENIKKKNGEGSIFQVSENKWVAKISLGTGANGKPVIKQFTGKTEAIVKKKLKDFRKSEDFAERHMPAQDTVQAYFTRWLQEYQYNKLKPASYDRLETTVRCHILPAVGGTKMDKLTRDDIQGLINRMYFRQGLSYSTVKKVYVALNACYKHALADDTVLRNPCLGIVLPSQSERTKQIEAFSEEEMERLQRELFQKTECGENVYYYAPAFLLILHTGMRMGEALSLTWDDVDFAKKTITICKNSILVKNRNRKGEASGGYSLQTQNSTNVGVFMFNDSLDMGIGADNTLVDSFYLFEVDIGEPPEISQKIICICFCFQHLSFSGGYEQYLVLFGEPLIVHIAIMVPLYERVLTCSYSGVDSSYTVG